ncbi:MAG: hypothetical protein AAF639_45590 [Chloroflexota bacterium]
MRTKRYLWLIVLLLMVGVLSACSRQDADGEASPTHISVPTNTPTLVPTLTSTPTSLVPTPSVPDKDKGEHDTTENSSLLNSLWSVLSFNSLTIVSLLCLVLLFFNILLQRANSQLKKQINQLKNQPTSTQVGLHLKVG